MRRTKKEAEQTKEEIFQAGLRVFSRKGFAAATIGDIARESNHTRGAIYWHFKSKDAFYLELYERVTSFLLKVVQECFNDDKPFIQNFRNTIETILFRFLEDNEWKMMNELLMHSAESQKFITLYTSYHANIYDLVAPIIQDAMDNGEIRKFSSPRIVFNLFSTISKGIMDHIICHTVISKAEIQEMIDVLVRGISTNLA